MAMHSPSSSFSYGFTYHVFLSFRGPDTRYSFTGNLYKALIDKGIHTFIDDNDLERGDEITPSLIKAIEESRIFIPVFSINYASSSFCLDELVHIIHCYTTKGCLVLPVFFGVDPSDVRHHTGSYGEDLTKHEERFQSNKDNMKRLQKWKIAINRAANLSGYHFTPGYEYNFIGEIVKYISDKINRVPLHVAEYPVGLESRVQHVKRLLDQGSDDAVHMVGLYGTGGSGKSTLAKEIYNFIGDQFEGLCFLHNVRENSAKNNLKHLQEEFLLKTIGLNIKIGDVSEGVPIIKERLCRKKILLILDDVDTVKQLQVLAGGVDWFGPGSRVIITTRDKHLLISHEIKRTYAIQGLHETEALELLRWTAFKNNEVPSSYEDILNRVVTYANGLPLVIEIVGSNLFGKRIEEWKYTLDGYENIPNNKIQEILKVSYDDLQEEEQSVFLDIACCFKGCKWVEVGDILHAHYGHCIKHHVRVLAEKSLIYHWKYDGDVTLHDLIEDMGKEVVRQQSLKEPGERSRLWCHDDIVHVLQENKGTSKIEMIYLNCPTEAVISWNGKAFKKMINLKTLIIKGGHFSKGSRHFPSSLRILEWQRYPLQCISFSISNKTFEKMKILKFDNCEYLTNISDVSCLPNLEKVSFKNCKNLITIHDSIGFLSKLQTLTAESCGKLVSFLPLKLNSLLKLELSYCTSLKKFPEILDKMKNISEINLIDTGIEELPSSFQNLTELNALFINGSGKTRQLWLPSSILMMSNLFRVIIYGCSQLFQKPNDKSSSMLSSNVRDIFLEISNPGYLCIALTWFSNVRSLTLSHSNIKILPECVKKCHFLERIHLNFCTYLEEIRGIPPNLKQLSTLACGSLTSSSKNILVRQELHEAGGTQLCFPSSRNERIPEWFEHQRREPSISFWFRNKIPSLVFFFSSKRMQSIGLHYTRFIMYLLINDHIYDLHFNDIYYSDPHQRHFLLDHTYIFPFDIQDLLENKSMLDKELLKNEWIHVKVMFGVENECEFGFNTNVVNDWPHKDVVQSGIHVLKHLTSIDDIQFTEPSLRKKRKSDEYLSSSHFYPLLKKKRLVDNQVSETEHVQLQQRLALLSIQ